MEEQKQKKDIVKKNQTIVPDNFGISKTLYSFLTEKTPREYVKKRKGRGGLELDYVETGYVVDQLNKKFNCMWSFRVLREGVGKDKVWVLGELTVYIPTQFGIQPIVKTQYGGGDIKKTREGGEVIDVGDDLKGAASDALKKCASLLGIASDIYWQDRTFEERGVERNWKEIEKDVREASPAQKNLILKLIGEGKIKEKIDVNKLTMGQASTIISSVYNNENNQNQSR